MRIEQRLVTTIDFLEPKPRRMAVIEEAGERLLRITAADEQCEIRFSAADHVQLCEALARGADRRDFGMHPPARGSESSTSSNCSRVADTRAAVSVEHRLVSRVDLGQGRPRQFTVTRDSWGCKISGSRPGDMVQILMSHDDCRKLCSAVLGEVEAERFEPVHMVMPTPSQGYAAAQFVAQLSDAEWLAYN